MPIFVHLAPAKAIAHIRRAGIKRGPRGVFCMPMLPDYYSTHQWARELKRRGHRTMLAIAFRLDDTEPVSLGVYNRPHRVMSASEAVKALLEVDDPLGYEVIVPRSISARELRAIRSVPHVLGWRFYPAAHGRRSCMCDWCSRGDINRRRIMRYQKRRGTVYSV